VVKQIPHPAAAGFRDDSARGFSATLKESIVATQTPKPHASTGKPSRIRDSASNLERGGSPAKGAGSRWRPKPMRAPQALKSLWGNRLQELQGLKPARNLRDLCRGWKPRPTKHLHCHTNSERPAPTPEAKKDEPTKTAAEALTFARGL